MAYACARCGHLLVAREMEIRIIKTASMKLESSERITDIRCPSCGWVFIPEACENADDD